MDLFFRADLPPGLLRHVGGANLPQPVPFVPTQPVPPMQPTPELPPPEIVEPPLPGHFPLLGKTGNAVLHLH